MQRRWFRRGGLVTVGALCWIAFSPHYALGAEVTDVADAADTIRVGNLVYDDAFDLYLGTDFETEIQSGRITREPIDRAGMTADGNACTQANARDCRPVDELKYSRNRYLMRVRGEVGLYHDLALTLGWTYVMSDNLAFGYAKGVDGSNSSIDPTTGDVLFKHDYSSKHSGSGNMDMGLKWAPLSDERDESKPMWVLKFNWSAPWTAQTYKPDPVKHSGPVGDGVHRLTFGMALSKRIANFGLIGIDPNIYRRGYIDPYMELLYTLPVPQDGRAQNSLVKSTNNPFGSRPSHEGRLNAGFEIVPIEDAKNNVKLAIDVGLRSTYYSQGRNYSELTDALGRLTYTDDYLYLGGVLGVNAQVAEALRLRAGINIGYNTEHFLTDENVGEDKTGDNEVVAEDGDLINPYFDGRFDQIGFRLRDERHWIYNFSLGLLFTF